MRGIGQLRKFLMDNHHKPTYEPVRIGYSSVRVGERKLAFGFFTIRISVRLSDRSLHGEEQKKNSSKIAQSGLNPGPLDHHSNDQLTVLDRYVLARRFLK